jgi:hypothetical protein
MRWILIAFVVAGCGDATFDLDGGDQVAAGRAYVAQRQCGTCHDGEKGPLAGRATPLAGTQAYAANLTPDRATGLGGWADVEIVRAMRWGYDNQSQPLCPPMTHTTDPTDPTSIVAFDDMDDAEARAIVAYLRSLTPVARPDIPGSVCPPLKPGASN